MFLTFRPIQRVALFQFAFILVGCGGRAAGYPTPIPISIYFPLSTVTVLTNGTAANFTIQINSRSETAVVSVSGTPSGVQVTYAASDTNPSGLLVFTASSETKTGTYMPTVTVNSAGQTASLNFTLIVKES
jgi:hypothetical protein